MRRLLFSPLVILAFIQFCISIPLSPPSLAQEWKFRVKPQGTVMIVNLWVPAGSVMLNYAEPLITLDKNNNYVPCLAEDLRWMDERTIEFELRKGVTFHNGEEFNAEAVKVNWEVYRKMERPTNMWFKQIPDDTAFEIIDRYTVRFAFPEPEGLAFVKFWSFPQIAPAFFRKYKFSEKNWAYLPESGPWGTGPFKLVEGSLRFGKPGKRVVLEAYERYWDRQYPKVQKLIFDNTLIGNREEAMRLCRETEGAVDIVTHIRPLDTLKVAESQFAKVVKSKDVNHLRCWFNQRKRDSKWRDVRLRKAVNYAVNREELWKYAAKGNAYNLGCYIPPGAYGHNPDLNLYTYDTTKARALLAEAGYPDGFEMNIITSEPWKLEAQIITSMLGRIGLKARLEILTWPEFLRQTYLPLMDSPPEQQLWDLSISYVHDYHGHTGASFLTYVFLDSSDFRWIAYDPVYEKMWEDMTRIVDSDTQEEKIQWMVKYLYDHAHFTPIYSPLSLYAVNKEVNFIPHKCGFLRLKETSVTENHWSVKGENE